MTDTGKFTNKQIDILEKIRKGADNGDFIDTDQLLEKLSYQTTKESIQCSLRFLVQRGLIQKEPRQIRRSRKRAVYSLTPQAMRSFDTSTGQVDIVYEGFEDLDVDLSEL